MDEHCDHADHTEPVIAQIMRFGGNIEAPTPDRCYCAGPRVSLPAIIGEEWNGVEIGEHQGVVRVPRRTFQYLLPERPIPERNVEITGRDLRQKPAAVLVEGALV